MQEIDPFNLILSEGGDGIERMTRALDEMVLEQFVSPPETEFIISDNPACPSKFTLDESLGAVELVGLPLSPQNALIFSRALTTSTVDQVIGVNIFNALQVAGSMRYTFSTNKTVLLEAANDATQLLEQLGTNSLIT